MKYENKRDTAERFGISVTTLDHWIRRGCPFVTRGDRTHPWEFDLVAVATWRAERDLEQKPKAEGVPEWVEEMFERRPDLRNVLRFISEDGTHNFLRFWCERHPGALAQLFEERGLAKLEAIGAAKDCVAVILYGYVDWITGDVYNKTSCHGDIDALSRNLTGAQVTTFPPDQNSIRLDLADWLHLPNEALVQHWLEKKGMTA